jgi:hypothetical protein
LKSCWKRLRCRTKVLTVLGSVAVAVFVLIASISLAGGTIGIRSPFFRSVQRKKGALKRPPFEFLFIDVNRLGSYLAQLEGGAFARESLGEKVVKSTSGSVEVVNTLKAGGSSEEEEFVERQVTPTASSSLVELEEDLENLKDENTVETFIHTFSTHISAKENGLRVSDGRFVIFHAAVRAPIYLDPYVALHDAATASALFPVRSRNRVARTRAKARRDAARKFERQVGENPRAVIALQPTQHANGKPHEELPGEVTLLMPIHLDQLNQDPSLLRAGGEFTVVGKVVRVFGKHVVTEKTPIAHRHSYVDFSTLEAWQRPLRTAPDGLICRASYACTVAIEGSGHIARAQRRRWIRHTRQEMLTALKRDTRIDGKGAVILPVAIYR